MSALKKTPITAAFGYPKCTNCGALKGDPCRAPSGKTRFPHAERDTAAASLGIPRWHTATGRGSPSGITNKTRRREIAAKDRAAKDAHRRLLKEAKAALTDPPGTLRIRDIGDRRVITLTGEHKIK